MAKYIPSVDTEDLYGFFIDKQAMRKQNRRRKEKHFFNRSEKISQFAGSAYIDTSANGGKYFKYLKNSNRQQFLKRVAAKRVRRSEFYEKKGNGYRKTSEYAWELF